MLARAWPAFVPRLLWRLVRFGLPNDKHAAYVPIRKTTAIWPQPSPVPAMKMALSSNINCFVTSAGCRHVFNHGVRLAFWRGFAELPRLPPVRHKHA